MRRPDGRRPQPVSVMRRPRALPVAVATNDLSDDGPSFHGGERAPAPLDGLGHLTGAGDQDPDPRYWRLTSGGAGPPGSCPGDHMPAAGVQVRLVLPIACVSDRYFLFVLNPVACP